MSTAAVSLGGVLSIGRSKKFETADSLFFVADVELNTGDDEPLLSVLLT